MFYRIASSLLFKVVIIFKMIISLENFDQYGRGPFLNSPRSLQACKRQGIDPSQLFKRTPEQLRHIYKDCYNDKKSLNIKMQHYESRRKGKLQLVRKQRIDILTNVKPVYRPNHAVARSRVEVVQVEDKLQKKRMMDEVKAEIMQKQLALKEAKAAKKLSELEHKKNQAKFQHKCMTVEVQKRKQRNKMEVDLDKQVKVNNYLMTEAEKEVQVQKALNEKKTKIEQIKRQKDTYYEHKVTYAKELQQYNINQKRQKVESKFTDLDKRKEERQNQEMMYRTNVQEQRRKDEIWKQTKRKQVELDEKKRQGDIWQALKYKDLKKEQYIGEIDDKRSKFYNGKKQDRQAKQQLVRAKQDQVDRHIEKKRRIMQLVQADNQRQLEQKKQNQKLQIQAKREDYMGKQKERLQKLKQDQEDKKLSHQYLLQKQQDKLDEIEKKKRIIKEQEQQKNLVKELKAKETEENRRRLEKIQAFEKQEKMAKYNQKVTNIEQMKREPKSVKVVRKVSREEVESRILQEHQIDHNRSRRGDSQQKGSREKDRGRVEMLKKEARRDPIEVKQKLKMQQINKLIQTFKIQCNKEEYMMMKEQDEVERQRQELQKTAESVAELRRLQKIHGVQRARFQDRLTAVMKTNQAKVQQHRTQLLK